MLQQFLLHVDPTLKFRPVREAIKAEAVPWNVEVVGCAGTVVIGLVVHVNAREVGLHHNSQDLAVLVRVRVDELKGVPLVSCAMAVSHYHHTLDQDGAATCGRIADRVPIFVHQLQP